MSICISDDISGELPLAPYSYALIIRDMSNVSRCRGCWKAARTMSAKIYRFMVEERDRWVFR